MAVAPVKAGAVFQPELIVDDAGGRYWIDRHSLGDCVEFEVAIAIGNDNVVSDHKAVSDIGVATDIVDDLVGVCYHEMGIRVTLTECLELGIPFRSAPN
jgi:hypothetical protein